ncbi:MAG: efflux RND transporter periplasmic adaptor subunit [Gammaproteobacteria bacterium]|nr:efflux RND transporter periplasmic adaptor subunit [Gammaproteobacteria bacterium]
MTLPKKPSVKFFPVLTTTRSRRWASALLILPMALLASACRNPETQAPPPPPPPQVSVASVIERQVADSDEFSGRLEAVESVQVRSRVTGYIESISFQQGKDVKRGEVLFVIDPGPYRADLNRAEAELARSLAQAELDKSQLARAEKLLQARMIAQQEYDDRASAQHQSEASVRAAKAAVDLARLNLAYTRVTSPISGRTGRAEVTTGNLVTGGDAGATVLTTVVSHDPIYAYFEGDEHAYLKYAAATKKTARNPVSMGLSNEQGYPHQGYLDFIDNRLDPATGTIRIRAVFDNKQGLFTPGLFARLKLGGGRYNAVLIDDRAVGTDQSKKFVMVLGSDNKANYRPVTLGPVADGLRVVREGLKAGEVIVVDGLQRVRPGAVVTPQKVPMEKPPANSQASSAQPQHN